jgi:sugar phosphate isomerase/epimerase
MSKTKTFRVGVTLHSFTSEYCSFIWSFEDMMQRVALLGGGVEIVGPAHQRGFPELTPEFERVFRSSVERNGLTPTSYGSYADPFMLPGRDLTGDEMLAYTIPQLKGAAKLGFPVVRLQYFVYPIAERLLPVAEKYNLKMGYELHSPLEIEAPLTQKLIEQVRRIGSPHLGLIPDGGIFTRSIPKFRIDGARRGGVSEPLLARAVELWKARTALKDAREELKAMGADDRTFGAVEAFWGSFGHSDPKSLAGIMPYIIHTHGKFFSMVDGDEPDVRYEEYVQALVAGGYTGWMSSEYEGPETDSFEVVKAHQAMVKRYIAKYAAS